MATIQSEAGTQDELSGDGPLTIAAAVDLFFGDLRLSPRTKKTYFHGIDKFLKHVAQHEGIDPDVAPVTALRPEHVTAFAAILVPPDIRTPEEVSQMRTAQNNLSAVRKLCSYLASYDLNTELAGDRLKTRIAAMMPRFTPPPPDVKLSDLKGKVVVLNFWATWCGPCKVEIPAFVELQDKYRGQGVVFLGLSVDDPVEKLKPFVDQYKINYPILLGDGHDDVQEAFGPIYGIPVTILIGRDGKICRRHMGIAAKEQVERDIKGML